VVTPGSIRGHGLNNMQSRAHALGGRIDLSHCDGQAMLTLVLPACLAES
jgi:signal transduction histidine kinase